MTNPRIKVTWLIVFAAWISVAFVLNRHAILQSTKDAESLSILSPDRFAEWHVKTSADLPVLSISRSPSSKLTAGATSSWIAAPWERHLTKVCSVFPGEGAEEGGRMGYQILYRLHYFLQKATKISKSDDHSLLCIWVADNSNTEMDEFLLHTLHGKCDGFLQVYLTSKIVSGVRQSNGNNHRIHIFATTEGLRAVFAFIAELSQYRWFHWTDPYRCYFVPENLFYLLQADRVSSDDQAIVIQSWVLKNAEANKEYRDFFGSDPMQAPGCDRPRAGNRQVARLLSQCFQIPTGNDFSAVQDWISSCLTGVAVICLRPNKARDRQENWIHLRRYSEIALPRSWGDNPTDLVSPTDTVFSLIRIHSILHGACDKVWNKVLGALDENGKFGYVHDPYYIKNYPQPLNYHVPGEPRGVCEIPPGQGDEGEYGYLGLKKIQMATAHQNKKRVLCMIYTQSTGHFRLQAIAETWGPRCDGFFAASNQTDKSIGAVNLLHEGPEIYDNMWLKVRAMFQYAYDHYLNDFDLFHIGGDDHYLIPENLRFTAATGSWSGPWDDSTPLLLGGSLALKKRRYCNGGSGYTLNRAALKVLVENLFHNPTCMPHWRASYEDRLTSACFRSAGILCTDTNDDWNETRYHTWNVDQHASWNIGKPGQNWQKLVKEHGIAWKEGLGQISQSSVSFHLKNPDATSLDSGMRRYHVILYDLCKTTTSKEAPERTPS